MDRAIRQRVHASAKRPLHRSQEALNKVHGAPSCHLSFGLCFTGCSIVLSFDPVAACTSLCILGKPLSQTTGVVLISCHKVVSVALVMISCPKTTPISLLALYTSLFVSHLILFVQDPLVLRHESIAAALAIFASLLAIVNILRMPMRDPDLPDDQICQAFNPPDPWLRSPEDNLTLWQFMSVSWMTPLISLGSTRQLNDQDVWQLGHEFQHSRLHETFRELPGSVLRRIIIANWIDLVIVSLLGLLGLVAGMVFLAERRGLAEQHCRVFITRTITATPPVYGRLACT
jgi:hypothetical protein